jgi:hypothetical protein
LTAKPSTNGNVFGIYVRPNYYAVALPAISIRSINLLELALRVRDTFYALKPDLEERRYKLTVLSIYS